MARCSRNDCRRWRPDALVRYTRTGLTVDGAWFCSAACVEFSTQQRLRDVQRLGTPVPADSGAPARRVAAAPGGDHAGRSRARRSRPSASPAGRSAPSCCTWGWPIRSSILRALAAQAASITSRPSIRPASGTRRADCRPTKSAPWASSRFSSTKRAGVWSWPAARRCRAPRWPRCGS